VQGLLSGAMAALVLSGHVRLWHVPFFAFVLGITHVFDIPARQSFVVEMVGKEDLPRAIGLNSSLFSAARVLGPWIAADLIRRLGAGPGELAGVGRCFLWNALSYVPVMIGLAAMRGDFRPKAATREPLVAQLRETAVFLRGHRGLRALLGLLAAGSLFMTADWILLPALAKYVFGTDANGFGALMALRGVGDSRPPSPWRQWDGPGKAPALSRGPASPGRSSRSPPPSRARSRSRAGSSPSPGSP